MPVLACPDCDHQFRVADLPPGTPVRCTNCQCQLAVPERKLRKRTVVEGHIGGRSDYIDAEDFVPVKEKAVRDQGEVQLNNALTVALIVGTTAVTIFVILTGGWLIHKNRMWGDRPMALGDRPADVPAAPAAAPIDPGPAAPPAAVEPPAAVPPMAPAGVPFGEPPPADPEAAWAKLVGSWDGEREERRNGVAMRVRSRLTFAADLRFSRAETARDEAGQNTSESNESTSVGAVAAADGYVRVTLPAGGPNPERTLWVRLTGDGRLALVRTPRRGDQPEEGVLTYNRAE